MSQYDPRILAVFKKLAGEKQKEVLASAKGFELLEKSPERALADALEAYQLGGAVNVKRG